MREPLQSRGGRKFQEIVKKVSLVSHQNLQGFRLRFMLVLPTKFASLRQFESGKNQSFRNSGSRDEFPDPEFGKVNCNT